MVFQALGLPYSGDILLLGRNILVIRSVYMAFGRARK